MRGVYELIGDVQSNRIARYSDQIPSLPAANAAIAIVTFDKDKQLSG